MEIAWGRFFRQFRKDRGLSLEEAVEGANCAPSTLSRFERGQADVNVDIISKIMDNISMTTFDMEIFLSTQPDYWSADFISLYKAGQTDKIKQQAQAYNENHTEENPLPYVKLKKLMYKLASTPPEKIPVNR